MIFKYLFHLISLPDFYCAVPICNINFRLKKRCCDGLAFLKIKLFKEIEIQVQTKCIIVYKI